MVNLATVHRIGHRLSELNIPLLPKLFQLFIFLCYSSAISYKVKIGKGLSSIIRDLVFYLMQKW